MTKQEKIRKGIRAFFESNFYDDRWHQPIWSLDFAVEKFITDTLHSQGVVIKSKNQKVPVTFGGLLKDNKDVFRVEPLI